MGNDRVEIMETLVMLSLRGLNILILLPTVIFIFTPAPALYILDNLNMKEKNLFDIKAEIPLLCHGFKWESDQLNPDLLIRLQLLLESINKKAHWEVIQTDHGYYGNCERESSYPNKNSFLYSLTS